MQEQKEKKYVWECPKCKCKTRTRKLVFGGYETFCDNEKCGYSSEDSIDFRQEVKG